jgi:inner membrane protein involved in colicin E2 resistance
VRTLFSRIALSLLREITPNRTYRRRVHQQSTVFSTEQEAIIIAIWLTEGTQRDKVNKKLRNKKQIILLWVPGHMCIPGNEQADEEAKAALDDDIQQTESLKRSRKMVKNRNDRKERWGNGSNNMKGRMIEYEYDGDKRGMTTNERNHRPTMPFLRHRTYSRPRPMGLHRN